MGAGGRVGEAGQCSQRRWEKKGCRGGWKGTLGGEDEGFCLLWPGHILSPTTVSSCQKDPWGGGSCLVPADSSPARLPKGTPVLLERRSSTGSLAPQGTEQLREPPEWIKAYCRAPNPSLRDSATVNQRRALHGDWAQVTVYTESSGAPDLEERPGHPPSTPFGEPSSCSQAYKWSQEGTQQVQSKQAAQGQPQPLWVPGNQKPQETKRFCPGLSEAEFYAHIYCPPGNFQMHCQ